jgi:hypothetical protein
VAHAAGGVVVLAQVPDVRLISCLPIDEAGQAAIKELKALASAPKAITDNSDAAAHAVQTPRIAAASPAAATDSILGMPSPVAVAAAGSQTSKNGKPVGTTAGESSSTAAGRGEQPQYSHPSGHSQQQGKQQLPQHIEEDIEEEEGEDSDRDEL